MVSESYVLRLLGGGERSGGTGSSLRRVVVRPVLGDFCPGGGA